MASSDTLIAHRPLAAAENAWGQALLLAAAGLFVFFWSMPEGIADAMRLSLPDNDDAMRLLSLRDFLAGQSWFDMTQYRYLPPVGASLHWSRLAELPLLALLLGLRPFLGPDLAERATVTMEPIALFVLYCGVAAYGAGRIFGPRAAGFAVLVSAQMVVFGDLFAPGRIDHHNIQIVLVAGCAITFGIAPGGRRAAIVSGALAGLSLAIGLETLVMVAAVGAAYVVQWVARGEPTAGALRAFGASLAVVAATAFMLETAPAHWQVPACDALSVPWLILTTLGAGAALALSILTSRLATVRSRLTAAASLGLIPVVVFALAYPACLAGPYQAVPEPYRTAWIAGIPEALPFSRFLEANPSAALGAVAPMLIGAIAAFFGAWMKGGRTAPMLYLLAALLGLGAVLAQVQIRAVYAAAAFLPLAAGWYLDRVVAFLGAPRTAAKRAAAIAGSVLIFGAPWALLPALGSAIVPKQAHGASLAPCQDTHILAGLDRVPAGTVLGQINLGPNLLLHTHHAIVVAGYHRAVDGIVAGVKAFSGNEADMRHEVEKHHADYVAICPTWLPQADPATTFAKSLSAGGIASWLQPLDLDTGPLKVWRVVKGS